MCDSENQTKFRNLLLKEFLTNGILGVSGGDAMNVVRLSIKNQISIPREVLRQIPVGPERLFQVKPDRGEIRIIPISPEPIIPQEALAAFAKDTLQRVKNGEARKFHSTDEAIRNLDKLME